MDSCEDSRGGSLFRPLDSLSLSISLSLCLSVKSQKEEADSRMRYETPFDLRYCYYCCWNFTFEISTAHLLLAIIMYVIICSYFFHLDIIIIIIFWCANVRSRVYETQSQTRTLNYSLHWRAAIFNGVIFGINSMFKSVSFYGRYVLWFWRMDFPLNFHATLNDEWWW